MKLPFILTFAITAFACRGQAIITTVAGTATCCSSADGGQATNTWLTAANGLAVDQSGNLYIWDSSASKIRKVNTAGIISTVAGNGTPGFSGDGGPAINAELFASGSISGIAVDTHGNLFFSDGQNHRVRKVDAAGIITTIAGNGTSGFAGDGGQATSAMLFYPSGIAVDSAGTVFIADSSNNRIRKVDTNGIITTVAGNGNVAYSGDNVAATTTAVDRPEGVTVDGAGNLYISETSQSRVRKVNAAGMITTVAGQTKKTIGFSGDGGLATAATLSGPIGLAVDHAGNLYIADNGNGRIRKVDAAAIITTIAGNGQSGSSGDGGPATSAALGVPKAIALDSASNLYIGGSGGGVVRVRKVSTAAALSANPASLSFSYTIGDAAPAAQAVAISSAAAGLSFTAAASTTLGGNWLTVNPTSGATPATLNVSVTPTGLAGGIYNGAITLTPSGAGNSPQTLAVTLTIHGAGAPVFSGSSVYNATGYQTKLAPDTVFVIFGSGMGPDSIAIGTGPNYPEKLAGTSITFTPVGGGSAISAKMIYTLAGQVAGLLPSAITPATYSVQVTYNTLTSVPQNVTVVARSFGIAAANSGGSGTAQATLANVNGGISLTRFTTSSTSFGGLNWKLSPAHPGDTVVFWGTGGGADPANDSGGTSGDQSKAGNFIVTIGGRQITPLYAGASSGYPGLWQVNFTLPADITPDCFATAQVSAGGELSNTVSIPIAAAGQDACSVPQVTTAALAKLDAGGTITLGGFGISKASNTFTEVLTLGAPPTVTTASQESIGGGIGRYTAAEFAAVNGLPKIGACSINDTTAANGKYPGIPDGYLDAGATIPVAGPQLAASAALGVVSPGPIYSLSMANGTVVPSGKYTLNGKGGKDVAAFTASTTFPSSFNVTNWDAITTIDRTQPLVISWTGGDDQVYIIINSSAVVGKDASNANLIHNVAITCPVPAAPGTYTVPVAVLAHLLPEGIDAASLAKGAGIIAVEAVNSTPFSAPLVGGGQTDLTAFVATLAVSKNLVIQ